MEHAAKVRTCLWFDKGGVEAAREYVSLVPNSRIETVRENGQPDDPMVVEFTLAGAPMMILTAGPHYKLTPAASISILTEDQDETDRLWDALTKNGGEPGHCGWVVDRFGVSWQIVPKRLPDLLASDDPAVVGRVSAAMMQMGKIDIAALDAAAAQEVRMGETTEIACSCGRTRLEVRGDPIDSVECCCASCREAAKRMQRLDRAPQVLTEHGTTPFVICRKDRVRFLAGADGLKTFRLSPQHATKRAIATCCNTPVYLEFKGGHWLSLYGGLWPDGTMPAPTMRTMASDLPEGAVLPDDIPNAKTQNLRFFAKLFGAWVAMGFRNPKTPATGEINV